MKNLVRLAQLEDEASLNIRTEEALTTNPEYLDLSIEAFLEKNDSLLLMDKFKAQDKLDELCLDPNFKLMRSLYGFYFDDKKNKRTYSVDLSKLSSIEKFKDLEKAFVDAIGGANCEGIISPEGIFYPAVKSHYCLCSWLNLNGVDIRGFVRTTFSSKSRLIFSDLANYVYFDKDEDFNLTEQQVKAMETLYRIDTKDSKFASFHNAVEESYRYGFCRFKDQDKTRKSIRLFEDVLGKQQVDSAEILSTKIKYF